MHGAVRINQLAINIVIISGILRIPQDLIGMPAHIYRHKGVKVFFWQCLNGMEEGHRAVGEIPAKTNPAVAGLIDRKRD